MKSWLDIVLGSDLTIDEMAKVLSEDYPSNQFIPLFTFIPSLEELGDYSPIEIADQGVSNHSYDFLDGKGKVNGSLAITDNPRLQSSTVKGMKLRPGYEHFEPHLKKLADFHARSRGYELQQK